MPERMPDKTPERVPEDMPDRMPKDMSERMPDKSRCARKNVRRYAASEDMSEKMKICQTERQE